MQQANWKYQSDKYLQGSPDETEVHRNVPVLNALVLYCGSKHSAFLRAYELPLLMSNIADSSHFDVLECLAMGLDPEGKYWFFSALVDQLRYPSSHTVYFKLILIHLFVHSNDAVVQVRY